MVGPIGGIGTDYAAYGYGFASARAAGSVQGGQAVNASTGADGIMPGECKTCAERQYVDGSDDSGVSFQTPTNVKPEAAASAVMSHEQEHVSREKSKAESEGRKVVNQNVQIHTGVCPECGKTYVSGGTTTTTTANDDKPKVQEPGKGQNFDRTA